jgi:hypothetical protein
VGRPVGGEKQRKDRAREKREKRTYRPTLFLDPCSGLGSEGRL